MNYFKRAPPRFQLQNKIKERKKRKKEKKRKEERTSNKAKQ